MRFLLVFFCFIGSVCYASEPNDCANKQSTVEIVACHEARYVAADKTLNRIYAAAMRNLSENEKAKLRESQRAWLRYRDTNFVLVIAMNSDEGSYYQVAIASFKANFVEQRVRELKDLLSGPGERPDWLR